jgi:hypothetical protein
MLNRIIGAFLFRKGVYAEVAKDTGFTTMAWIIVVVVALLNQFGNALGSAALSATGVINWTAALVIAILGTILALIGFALGALVIAWVGKLLFKADTNFSEMVRVLGLAYVWQIVGFFAILALISPALICVVAPIALIAALLYLIAELIAVKAALELDWLKTIVTVIVGWVVVFLIGLLGGTVIGIILVALGMATATPGA